MEAVNDNRFQRTGTLAYIEAVLESHPELTSLIDPVYQQLLAQENQNVAAQQLPPPVQTHLDENST